MEIVVMKVADLTPAEYNPRVDLQPGDPVYERLKKSILEFGMVDPVIWNKRTKRVVGGHQRLKILAELDTEHTEVSVVDLSEEREKALNIALNKIAGDWDLEKLQVVLQELSTADLDFDLDAIGFSDREIDEVLSMSFDEDMEDIDDAPIDQAEELKKKWGVKKGQLWVMGRHAVLCDDTTRAEGLKRLFADMKADMVWTDPPYGVDYSGRGKQTKKKIQGDAKQYKDHEDLMTRAFTTWDSFMKQGCPFYVCHAEGDPGVRASMENAVLAAGWNISAIIVWVKQTAAMGWADYRWQHEPIMYGWKPGKHYFYGARDQTTVWDVSRDPQASYLHPTQKPVELVSRSIRNSSRVGAVVFDGFLGSGTTILACQRANRIGLGVEVDPSFVAVALERGSRIGLEPHQVKE